MNLRQCPFGLLNLKVGRETLGVEQADFFQQSLLGFHLSIGNVQTGLQAANGDVGVCSLRGNGQSGGGPIRLGRLILGERGFAGAS